MDFSENLLNLLKTTMTKPTIYGTFHIVSLIITVGATIALCKLFSDSKDKTVQRSILVISLTCLILEIYKQATFGLDMVDGKLIFEPEWYAFPFQFCSSPMYVGILAGIIKKGRFREKLYAFLATFAVFAGLCVMIYPGDVYMPYVGINIQTMFCHGSMIAVGVALLYSGSVEAEHKTILKAIPVFSTLVVIAMIMNETAYFTGLLETHTFNMFFISRHCEPSLPVYSLIQPRVPYVVSVIIYIIGFSLASYLVLLAAILIKKLAKNISGKKAETPQ